MKRLNILLIILSLNITLMAQAPREMRAAWIATVENIDWPKSPVNYPAQHRQQMIEILDTLQALNFNAIFVQIRPAADALYYSEIEPWSKYLTGTQGVAPEPEYDPLKFIIDEAHRRCIEVHAWINPYRASMNTNTKELAKTHLYRQKPELFVKYGDKLYFNPAKKETRQHLNRIVADIVKRYDIDAIHMDDYFYPYPVAGQEFPDRADFKANPRGYTNIKDWRRDNVTIAITELQETIKKTKPWVEFGISPFGVWRNKKEDKRGSNTTAFTNYDGLYADILYWLEEGYIDYVVPQLYWEIGKKVADYKVLVHWWSANCYKTNLYIGLYASQLGNKSANAAWRNGNELMRQLKLNEQYPQIKGTAFYSVKAIMENRQGIRDSLHRSYFTKPALVPTCRLVKNEPAGNARKLKVLKENDHTCLHWVADDNLSIEQQPVKFVVYFAKGNIGAAVINPNNIIGITADDCYDIQHLLTRQKNKYTVAIVGVNRYKRESIPIIKQVKL